MFSRTEKVDVLHKWFFRHHTSCSRIIRHIRIRGNAFEQATILPPFFLTSRPAVSETTLSPLPFHEKICTYWRNYELNFLMDVKIYHNIKHKVDARTN